MKTFLLLILFYSNIFALEILYEIEEPFIYKKDGKVTGYTLSPVLKALKKTDIRYTFSEKPFKEQLQEIKNNQKEVCAIGWNKIPSFEEFTKYTDPIYKERPYGIITQDGHDIKQNTDIQQLIDDRKYRALVKKDFNYPKDIAEALEKLPKKEVKTTKDYNLVTLIAKKKADFTFMSYSEAMGFIETHKYRSRVKFVELSGLKGSQIKYLACSLKVKESTLEKINNQLK